MSDTTEVTPVEVKLSVTVTRHYGAVSVGFEISGTFMVKTRSDVMRENNRMLDTLDIQIEDYERTRLPNLPVPQTSGKNIANDMKGAPSPKWFPAKELYFTVKDKKKYWYVRPTEGNWTKFGAAVYWDRMNGLTEAEAKDMIDPETFSHTFGENIMVLIEIFQGKPRAIAIAHRDTIGK